MFDLRAESSLFLQECGGSTLVGNGPSHGDGFHTFSTSVLFGLCKKNRASYARSTWVMLFRKHRPMNDHI